jgi:hypothetical protein
LHAMLWNLLRRWLVVAITVPLAAKGARRLSDAVESRRGPSRGTALLRRAADGVGSTFGRKSRRKRRWLPGRA